MPTSCSAPARRAACGVFMLLVWAVPVRAQDAGGASALENGTAWLARCGSLARAGADTVAEPDDARCIAWIEGLIDINEIYRGLGALDQSPEGFCMPQDATVREAARAVAHFMDDHPETLRFSARILAYVALRGAFPCEK